MCGEAGTVGGAKSDHEGVLCGSCVKDDLKALLCRHKVGSYGASRGALQVRKVRQACV